MALQRKIVFRVEDAQFRAHRRQMRGYLRESRGGFRRLGGGVDALSGRFPRLGRVARGALGGIAAAITAVVAVIVKATKQAVEFETAMTGVSKTVNATEAEFAALEAGIRRMAKEVPASTTEIARVAEAAGQLGVQTDKILGFTRTMIDLGVATNLSADQAATALARLANITQLPQDQFDRLGSTVVDLGNSLATTEAEIVDMALRLAGAGNTVGLTEAQILGLAGALSSVGVQAELGGSTVSRILLEMQEAVAEGGEQLENFARGAGVNAREFAETFERDAAGALVKFLNGLQRLSDSDVVRVLDRLESKGIRVRDVILRLSNAGDLLAESIDLSSKAWKENTALAEEAGRRYATTASQITIFLNRIKDLGITLGERILPTVNNLLEGISNKLALLDSPTENLLRLLERQPGIDPLIVAELRVQLDKQGLQKTKQEALKELQDLGTIKTNIRFIRSGLPDATRAFFDEVDAAGFSIDQLTKRTNLYLAELTKLTEIDTSELDFFSRSRLNLQIQFFEDQIERVNRIIAARLRLQSTTEALAQTEEQLAAIRDGTTPIPQGAFNQTLTTRGLFGNTGSGLSPTLTDAQQRQIEAAKKLITTFQETQALLRTSPDLRDELQTIFDLDKEILDLEKQIREVRSAPEADELRAIQKTREARKEAVQERLRQLGELQAFIDATGGLLPATILPPNVADLREQLQRSRAVEKINAILKEVAADIEAVNIRLGFGEISEDEATAEIAQLSETARQKLKKLFNDFKSLLPPEVTKRIESFLSSITDETDDATKKAAKLAKTFDSIATSGRAMLRLADALGVVSDEVRRIGDGALDALDNLGRLHELQAAGATGLDLLPAQVGLAAGIGTALAGILGGLLSDGDQTREELRALQEALRDNARDVSRAIEDFTKAARPGAGIPGEDAQQAAAVPGNLDAFQEEQRAEFEAFLRDTAEEEQGPASAEARRTFREQQERELRDFFLSQLDALEDLDLEGLDVDQLRELFNQALQSGLSVSEAIDAIFQGTLPGMEQGLQAFLDAIGEDAERYGKSVDGAVASMEDMIRFFGQDFPDAFKGFLQFLLSNVEGLSDDLRALLEEALGLDLTQEADRKRAKEIAQALIAAGPDFLGSLSPDDAEKIADILLQAAEFSPSDSTGISRGVSIARSITEVQASEVVALLESQLFVLQKILTALTAPASFTPLQPLDAIRRVTDAALMQSSSIPATLQSPQIPVHVGPVQVLIPPELFDEHIVQAALEGFEREIRTLQRSAPGA